MEQIVKEGYKLVKKEVKDGIYKVSIEADSNDGDYITTNATYTKEEFEKVKLPVLIDMYLNYGGRHEFESLPSYISEELDIPYSDWGACHTLSDLDISYIDNSGMYDLVFDKDELEKCSWKYVLQRLINDIEYGYYSIEDALGDDCINIFKTLDELKSMTKDEISKKYNENNIDKILFGLLEYEESQALKE